MRFVLLATIVSACAGPGSFGDPIDNPQVPPRGHDDIQAWIDDGFYMQWHCEPTPHPRRPPSPHGAMNRICSNDALAGSTGDGAFPIGAAAVKEVYGSDGAINAYAVYRKMTERSDGDSWYWYEGSRDKTAANGQGEGTCVGCHSSAPRDFVFTIVK
jgi:hypothetical protein